MSTPEIIAVGVALLAFAAGIMLGHAAGYARRGDVERRRQLAALIGGPRYAREPRSFEARASGNVHASE